MLVESLMILLRKKGVHAEGKREKKMKEEKVFKQEEVKMIINEIVKEAEKLDDPEEIALMEACKPLVFNDGLDTFFVLDYTIEKVKKTLMKTMDKSEEEEYVIAKSHLIENILTNVIVPFEGTSCSVDKARSIMRCYIDNKSNIEHEIDNSKWYHPSVGTTEEWVDLCEGAVWLAHLGKFTSFIKALAPITQKYQEWSKENPERSRF